MANLDLYENYVGVGKLHKHWLSFFFLGLLLVILGILAIIGAYVFTIASVIFFGILLAIGGILQVGYAFWGRKGQSFAITLISGILYAIAGILMFTHPTVSALTITILLAALFTVSGIYKIIMSLTVPLIHWGWLLFNGIVSLTLGILIWAEWPWSGLWVIGTFIGIDLIIVGWFWIMLSTVARSISEK